MVAVSSMFDLAQRGLADLQGALKQKNLWWALALEDVADSHRRTVLGPVWQLLNYVLFVITLILILGQGAGSFNFTAYVAAGLLVWLFISETLTMSATLFTRERGMIQGTVLPMFVYVLRQTSVSTIRFFCALPGAIGVLLYSGIEFTPALATVVPAIILLLLTAPAVAILIGVAGVFFRDMQFIVTNAMRFLIFLSPIFWAPEGASAWQAILYNFNPITHYIEIIRQPVIAGIVPDHSWSVALSITALISITALLLLGKFNRQIVFYL